MILRPTKIEDISRVIDIINQAKTYFKNNDIDQWQDGYPNEETIEKDIENNEAYVLEEDGVILGTCMVTIHGEPAYNRIEGKWILNCPYICVHRIAVDNEYKGNTYWEQAGLLAAELSGDLHCQEVSRLS